MKSIVLSILFIFISSLAYAGGSASVGTKAPNIMGRMLDGKLYRLSSDKGSPKLINFFWVYCKPCKKEMPELGLMEKEFPGVKFLAVHTVPSDEKKVNDFIKGMSKSPSNIILGNKRLKETYKYMGLPFTVLLDSNNVIKLRLEGYTEANMNKLRSALSKL